MIDTARALSRRRLLRGAALAGASAAAVGCATGPGAATTTQPEIKGTVQIWGIPLFDFNADLGAEIVREFEAKHQGAKIEYVINDDQNGDKTRIAAAGGTPPDLVSPNGLIPQSLAADGVAASFEPFLKTSKVIRKADLWPTFVNDHSWKGELVGMAYGPDIRIMYLGTDRYQRAGLDVTKPPKTWAEFENVVTKTTERDATGIKTAGWHPFIGSGTELTWCVPFWQLGGELLSADGTKVTIDNEKGIQALEWLTKVINLQGGWGPLQDLRRNAVASQRFVDGALANYYEANSSRTNDAFAKGIQSGFKYGFTHYPLPPGGRRITFGGVHTYVMAKASKSQAAAWAFIEHLLSPEVNIRFADRYDRIPVRQSIAKSAQYIRNDPFRQLSTEEMSGRRWMIPAPGAWGMRDDIRTVALDILDQGLSIRAALAKTQAAMQQKLDAALQAAKM